MRSKILTVMGALMLLCLVTFGFFAFPVGIPICSAIGLFYGIKTLYYNCIGYLVCYWYIHRCLQKKQKGYLDNIADCFYNCYRRFMFVFWCAVLFYQPQLQWDEGNQSFTVIRKGIP